MPPRATLQFANLCFAVVDLCRGGAEGPHSGTGLTCDQDTYHRRLWCRVELFSHYLRRGRDAMYLLQEDQALASVDQSWLLDALFVFEGDCTCCLRKHEGMKCDKPFVRDLMLGLYAEVLNFKKKDDSDQSRRCCKIFESIEQNKNRVFPTTFSKEFTIRRNSVLARHRDALARQLDKLNIFEDLIVQSERRCVQETYIFGSSFSDVQSEGECLSMLLPSLASLVQPVCLFGSTQCAFCLATSALQELARESFQCLSFVLLSSDDSLLNTSYLCSSVCFCKIFTNPLVVAHCERR